MSRILQLLVALFVLVATPAYAADGTPGDTAQREVVVRRGDTLKRIAARSGVSVADLRKWNKTRIGKGGALKAGRKLIVSPPGVALASAPGAVSGSTPAGSPSAKAGGPTWQDSVLVRRGDSIAKIASREGVSVADLQRWNGLSPKKSIRAGQFLVIERTGPRLPAVSAGRPTAGHLSHGVYLGDGPGYRLRFPKNAYGTDTTIKVTRQCAKRVHEAFPGSAEVLVGDISRPGGGRFPPHEGHQSGRDVDVGYFLVNNTQNATMHKVQADQVDYAKAWGYLKCALQSGRVVRVFMDKKIQTAMAEFLTRKKAADPDQLRRLFGALGSDEALVRHAPKHDTHLHVRYACEAPPTPKAPKLAGPASQVDPADGGELLMGGGRGDACIEEEGDVPFSL